MADDTVLLRPCSVDDAGALAEMYSLDREAMEASEPWRTPTFFEVEGQRDRITRVWPKFRTLAFVSVQREEVVGLFLLEDVTDESALVGYYVAPANRGEGVATRSVALLAQIAFGDLGIGSLVADIQPHNTASRRVVERNGFRREGSVILEGVEHHRFVRLAADV
jgi:[ribosomal protein S5]-alanine N-acetyltransferase